MLCLQKISSATRVEDAICSIFPKYLNILNENMFHSPSIKIGGKLMYKVMGLWIVGKGSGNIKLQTVIACLRSQDFLNLQNNESLKWVLKLSGNLRTGFRRFPVRKLKRKSVQETPSSFI